MVVTGLTAYLGAMVLLGKALKARREETESEAEAQQELRALLERPRKYPGLQVLQGDLQHKPRLRLL